MSLVAVNDADVRWECRWMALILDGLIPEAAVRRRDCYASTHSYNRAIIRGSCKDYRQVLGEDKYFFGEKDQGNVKRQNSAGDLSAARQESLSMLVENDDRSDEFRGSSGGRSIKWQVIVFPSHAKITVAPAGK